MAFGYRCKHCGYEEEEHDVNLINEPIGTCIGGSYGTATIDEDLEGYRMSILICMETPLPVRYVKKWGSYLIRQHGYMSPDEKEEFGEHEKRSGITPLGTPGYVYIINTRRGSVVLRGE